MLRYIRIAVSMLCLAIGILLVCIWIRSYFIKDRLQWQIPSTRYVRIDSEYGRLKIISERWANAGGRRFWRVSTRTLSNRAGPLEKFMIRRTPAQGIAVFIPHWLPILMLAGLTASLYVKPQYRFSMRTLLIATTCIALLMGLISIWLTRL